MSGLGSMEWVEAGIPTELRAAVRWVAWRYIERDGRPTKVPLCAGTGATASATDPATWSHYTTAAHYARAHGYGIGIMLGDGLAGVDLDDCVTEAGELEPWARDIIAALASYTETSPSGHGLHVHVRGTLPGTQRRRGSVELYDTARFFCVTGHHLPWTPRDRSHFARASPLCATNRAICSASSVYHARSEHNAKSAIATALASAGARRRADTERWAHADALLARELGL